MFLNVLAGVAILLLFLGLFQILRWTYKKEKDLHTWKRDGRTRTRLSWRCENGQWRSLLFDMPISELQKMLGEYAKNNMDCYFLKNRDRKDDH